MQGKLCSERTKVLVMSSSSWQNAESWEHQAEEREAKQTCSEFQTKECGELYDQMLKDPRET